MDTFFANLNYFVQHGKTVWILALGLSIINFLYLHKEGKKLDLADKIINSALLWLVIGIPLLFSSVTRSVFEVWKLLLLRVVILVVSSAWITRRILYSKNNDSDIPPEERFTLFGLAWRKTGLEYPFLVWGVINVLATVFSQNVYVAIIGAYDRWEGIITIINYIFLFFIIAKLVKTESILHWVLLAIFGSTALSALYAIFQSVGIDFMHWSADPTQRTFACINNPVHYSAYIAMVVPLGMGWLLYQSTSDDHNQFFTGWLNAKSFSIMMFLETFFIYLCIYNSWSWYYLVGSMFIFLGMLVFNGVYNKSDKIHYFFKLYTFIATLIIYYSMYISYGRGTWMGFAPSMSFLYLILTGVIYSRSRKHFLADFLLTIPAIGMLYVSYAFNLYKRGAMILLPTAIIISAYALFTFWLSKQKSGEKVFSNNDYINCVIVFILTTLNISFGFLKLHPAIITVTSIASVLYVIYLAVTNYQWRYVFLRFVNIWAFLTLPFIAVSFKNIALYSACVVAVYWVIFRKDFVSIDLLNPERKRWLMLFLIIFGLTLALPMLPTHVQGLFAKQDNVSRTGRNIISKVSQLERQALEGSARISMWKTSLGWAGVPYPYFKAKDGKFTMALHSTAWIDGDGFKDKLRNYPILGTGPDTVKEMYPTFRRPDYGKLEGGHNLTPDKVHDEYLNQLITTGFSGFAVNYFWIFGAYIIIVLRYLRKYENNPYHYLILGAFIGTFIYQGQVFFNFGVVATKVLFYVLMGFAIAIGAHEIGLKKESIDEPKNI